MGDMEIRGLLKKIETTKNGKTTIILEDAVFSGTDIRDEDVLINIYSFDKTDEEREVEKVLKKPFYKNYE